FGKRLRPRQPERGEERLTAEVVPLEETRIEDDSSRVDVAPADLHLGRVLDHDHPSIRKLRAARALMSLHDSVRSSGRPPGRSGQRSATAAPDDFGNQAISMRAGAHLPRTIPWHRMSKTPKAQVRGEVIRAADSRILEECPRVFRCLDPTKEDRA